LAQDRGDYEEAERLYRQSLEISERIGHQAGMSASFHRLGMLAQLRNQYEEAERLYFQSLEGGVDVVAALADAAAARHWREQWQGLLESVGAGEAAQQAPPPVDPLHEPPDP